VRQIGTEMTRGSLRLDVGFTDFGFFEFFVQSRYDLMLDHLATTVWPALQEPLRLREMQTGVYARICAARLA